MFSYVQIACKNEISLTTDPFNIIFDDFGIWLLGYRMEFSCLYIPQGHIEVLCGYVTYRSMYEFIILSESPSLN